MQGCEETGRALKGECRHCLGRRIVWPEWRGQTAAIPITCPKCKGNGEHATPTEGE